MSTSPARPKPCTWLLAAAAVILCAAAAAAAAGQDYIHNIYLTTRKPAIAKKGRWVFDISTRERMEDMIGELARLGVNAMTYHSAYRSDGADYEPKLPGLQRASRWPADARPVDTFLDLCHRHGIAGSLAVFIYPNMHVPTAKRSSEDVVQVFRGRPGMGGYVPPIEGSPMRGLPTEDFLQICRRVRELAPKLVIMDYPNGPYSPAIVQTIVIRGASGLIDIENVQFHGADERLKNFVVTRGMTHLVMGMSARCRSIVHTHYKYGGGKAWLKPADAYKVRQEAVLTATPHGTSIFSFQHGFWGAETGPVDGDALWRRLVWYEGIIAVQRMLPVLHDARPRSNVAVLIPASTTQSGQELVERYWLPLARARANPRMFAYANQLDEGIKTIVCPSFEDCDSQQQAQLEAVAKAGATVIVPDTVGPQQTKWESERVRRILGTPSVARLDPKGLSPEFARALGGVTDKGRLKPVDAVRSQRLGKGAVVRAPAGHPLHELALRHTLPTLRSANLPEGYMIEMWETRTGVPFVKLLATEEGLEARDVSLDIQWNRAQPPVWFIDRTRVEPLPASCDGRTLKVRVPHVGEEYGVVLLGSTDAAILRPESVVTSGEVGQPVELACRVVNTTAEPARGTVRVSAPKGWALRPAQGRDYQLAPGQSTRCTVSVTIPADAAKRPHFVLFQQGKRVQRCVVFPTNGRPQVISKQDPPAHDPRRPSQRKPRLLTEAWRGVTAGSPRDATVAGNLPGACFLPRSREWDAPAEYQGKMARYGEVIPRLGGANFLLNNFDPAADVEVRLTYCASAAGQLQAYDGAKYHVVGAVAQADAWTTLTLRVPAKLLAGPKVERATHLGKNMMLELRVNGIYVHRIEVRRAPK